jgi:3-deoxy-D-manno-octulosonate 8-phosphate phosphatase (KDO 8-P phosphatase)
MPIDTVKLVVFDIDGVLTDGSIIWQYSAGWNAKVFDVKDGFGILLLLKAGLEVAFISGRQSIAVEHRAKDLGVKHVVQGADDKLAALREVMLKTGVREDEIAFVGDDLNDLPVLRRVGFACAPADAVSEVKQVAELVTRAPGGKGCAREVAEKILKAQDRWAGIVEKYLV